MGREDAELLERSTDTIVQQVETMKQMVNAFSEYARAPDMKVSRFNFNDLVAEVVELYRSPDSRCRSAWTWRGWASSRPTAAG